VVGVSGRHGTKVFVDQSSDLPALPSAGLLIDAEVCPGRMPAASAHARVERRGRNVAGDVAPSLARTTIRAAAAASPTAMPSDFD
jgi:hypothetical protein